MRSQEEGGGGMGEGKRQRAYRAKDSKSHEGFVKTHVNLSLWVSKRPQEEEGMEGMENSL